MLSNDGGAGLTVTAFDAASANGGTIVMNADGSFSYTPPAGFTGDDTFTYTAELRQWHFPNPGLHSLLLAARQGIKHAFLGNWRDENKVVG